MIYKDIFVKIASYCAYQERSEKEVTDKLVSWDLPPDKIETILQLLKEEKYLDNQRYIQSYVNGRFRIKKWGKIKIEAYLRQKGIESEAIKDSINEIPEEAYQTTIFQLIEKKNKALLSVPVSDRKIKIARYLASKGFESEHIWKAVNFYDFEL